MEIEKKKKIIAVAVVLILIVILSVFFWLSDSSEKPSENSDKISEVEIKPEEKTDEETIENTENSNLTEEPSEEPAKDSEEPVEEAEKPEEESETDKEEEEKIDEVIETENERVAEVDDQTQSGSVEQTESKEPSGTQEQTGAQEPSAGADTDKEKDDSSSSNTPDIPVREPESDYAQIANGKITCDAFGRYSGQYVEDGRDEPIESVATILVTNQSDEYLEYATLTFDIDGNAGNFIVTGLPPGASAWVMDASRLVIESGAAFTYLECVSSFRDDVNTSSEKINLTADGNMMSATNLSDETLEEVVVYYRVKHTDGNYLGGVTYTANFGTLEPGASIEVLAGHYSAANSEVVRVSWKD